MTRLPFSLLLLVLPGTAFAHVTQPPDGLALLAGESTPVVALETTIGLLLSTDGSLDPDAFRWVCHEALSSADALRIPRYVALPDGSMLATIHTLELGFDARESVYRTVDGCTWDAVGGLTDRVISELATDATGRVLATSANLEPGADNGVFWSDDGETFQATGLAAVDRYFVSARWGPAGRAWVGASAVDPAGAWVYLADDLSGAWTERTVTSDTAESPLVLETDPLAAERVWLRMDGFSEDRLLVTGDAGASWTVLWQGPEDVLDVTLLPDDRLYVALSGGGLLTGPGDGPLVALEDAPAARATHWVGGQHLVVSDYLMEGWVLGDLNGDLGRGLFSFRDLAGRLQCPAGTRTEQACAPLYETVERLLGIYINPDPPPPPDLPEQEGCGAGASAALLLGAPLLFLRRQSVNR